MPNFSRIKTLYHFTDASNLTSIAEHGGLYSWSKLEQLGIVVPNPGGNDWSHDADQRFQVDDYVHLCFYDQHPMEWRARQDGRLPNTAFLKVNPAVLDLDGVLFTDDVSNKSGIVPISRAEANQTLDFEVLSGKTQRNDPQATERWLRAKKYEVLVPAFVPISYITNFGSFYRQR
jgi:ssDNA thymidine ADP-ribosyltransferase, DarT